MNIAELRNRFTDPTPAELQLIADYGALAEDARRARAFSAFSATGLPHRRLEQWKWTDFRQALNAIEPGQAASYQVLPKPDDALTFKFDGQEWTVPAGLPDGLKVVRKSDGLALSNAENLPLAALAASLTGHHASDVLQIEVQGKIRRPVFMEYSGPGRSTSFSRVVLLVRADAQLDVVESHVGGAGLSSAVIEFGLEANAAVSRTILQAGSKSEAAAITAQVQLGEKAQFKQTALAFGAKVARIETVVAYDGSEAAATLDAAYLAGDGYHVDITSHVRHGAVRCVTRQRTKGAVNDGGRGVFQGKFLVPRTIGQHTDADMQHNALLLENGAEVFAKPELEIYADDVECAHGNTSGQLDEAALFYMRQRGLPLAEARALLTQAFIAEALETAHPSVHGALVEASQAFLQTQR